MKKNAMSLLTYPAAVNVEASVLRVDDGASKDTVREKKQDSSHLLT